jgi:predicted nucleic acid-binding protein
LPKLYGRILVPPSVCAELKAVRLWIAKPPAWLETRAPGQAPDAERLKARVDAGDRDAILLAQELGADNLIIDERRGRREAERRHLNFTGTLGVLRTAAKEGLLDFKNAIDRLRLTNYIAQDILNDLLKDQGCA